MTLIQRLSSTFKSTKNTIVNKFNRAFFRFVGTNYSEYDTNNTSYIDHGYNENSVVYSIVNQMATKVISVPYYIKKIKNKNQAKAFNSELKRWDGNTPSQKLNLQKLLKKAFTSTDENSLEMPLKRPNPLQTWSEFYALGKTYLRTIGNVYIYMPAPEGGVDAGQPIALYLLPAHLIQITLKQDAANLILENPVKSYILRKDTYYQEFEASNVVHIKLPNPNFDQNGEQLYGFSPLRAVLRNINTSNEATKQNLKLMQNSGVYGFVHGENAALTEPQAKELKSRLKEMDENSGRLSRLAGVSQKIGFTRLSLTTEELRPFDYLAYDQKQIANALQWSDKLLNNDDGAKYSNIQEAKKEVVINNIMPDLMLFEDAFNNQILPRFKGYENTCIYWDVSALPEMQLDMKNLTSWLTIALRDGVINRLEYRQALNYELPENTKDLEVFTIGSNVIPLEDALLPVLPDQTQTPPDDEDDDA